MPATMLHSVGSKDPRIVLKNKPRTQQSQPTISLPCHVTVRRAGLASWFTPNSAYTAATLQFRSGVMLKAVFNPNARPMADVILGTESVSDTDISGDLTQVDSVVPMPSGIKKACYVEFDAVRRVFHDKADNEFVVRSADYLILFPTGRMQAGWFAEFPDLTCGN